MFRSALKMRPAAAADGNKPRASRPGNCERTHKEAEDQRGEVAADEALPGLLRRELQERRDTGCLSHHHDISLLVRNM